MKTNLDSCFNMTKQVCDGMADRGWGRIINISSVNGQKGAFGQTNYSAAKAGMHGFTKALALEVRAQGRDVQHDLARLHRHQDGDGDPEGSARLARSFRRSRWAGWASPRRSRDSSPTCRQRGSGVPHRRQHRDQRRPAHVLTSARSRRGAMRACVCAIFLRPRRLPRNARRAGRRDPRRRAARLHGRIAPACHRRQAALACLQQNAASLAGMPAALPLSAAAPRAPAASARAGAVRRPRHRGRDAWPHTMTARTAPRPSISRRSSRGPIAGRSTRASRSASRRTGRERRCWA